MADKDSLPKLNNNEITDTTDIEIIDLVHDARDCSTIVDDVISYFDQSTDTADLVQTAVIVVSILSVCVWYKKRKCAYTSL